MSTTTKNLGLFKYDTIADENIPFNITNALNNNWDKLDEAISNTGGARNVGEIVASTIPLTDASLHLLDGSLIQGDGIYSDFVDYMANVYKTKDRIYNSSAFTVVGSPTITNDGIASGFSNSNYITANINTLNATSVRIKHKFKVTTTSGSGTIWCTGKFSGVLLQDGCIFTKLSSNGTSNNISSIGKIGSLKVNANTDYWIVYDWDGATHKIGLSTDDENYTYYTLGTGTTPIYINGTVYFGKGGTQVTTTDNILNGSLYQNEFSVVINGVDVLNGSTPAKYFTDETTWQASISQYGVCGKFVYDSVNNTVRLPKITGILEGTTDISALGDLVEAGLPNITGKASAGEFTAYKNSQLESIGALGWDGTYSLRGVNGSSDSSATLTLDASRSSSIYGNSSTVQPQTIKTFYYIVIATSTKTDIQVDIDEIATDLNGKVNKADLQEVQCIVETYVNGTSWYRVYSDGWCEQGGIINSVSKDTYTSATISLLKSYKNTNYSVLLTQWDNEQTLGIDGSINGQSVHSKRVNNFVIATHSWTYGRMWQACGFTR